MLLTEYDEEKHMRDTYKEGYEEGEAAGYSKGEQAGYNKGKQTGYNELLDELIGKKLSRGKTIPEIAEELEVDVSIVEERIPSSEQT